LNKCTEKEARDELGQSREALEAVLGERVRMFAYPNGRPNVDYGPEHVAMVRDAGYDVAVSTARGAAGAHCDLLQLPRFSLWGRSQWRMALQLSHNMGINPPTAKRRKRVLMVAFHFPPQSGSSGVLRTLNFVKHLPPHGWTPTVLSANARAYAERRDDLMSTIPSGTEVIRAFALDAARHFSIFSKYPRVLALPDRWWTWSIGGFLMGLAAIRRERPSVLWSTYPIASAHLIAASLARATRLPWIADFRDPMISEGYPSDPLQLESWERLEAHVIKTATCCVFTTNRAAQVYRQRYPHAGHKMLVIENGYDEDAFAGVTPVRHGAGADVLLLLHSGVIYPKGRDPSAFFQAVSRLINSGKLDAARVCLRFRAPSHVEELKALAEKFGLQDVIDIAPPIPYREAIAEMLGADFLLVFQGKDFNAQIPAKIYEYLRARRPLLAFVDPSGDTALQLKPFTAATSVDIEDADAIECVLEGCLAAYRDSAFQQALEHDWPQISSYSRAAQARSLAALLDTTARGIR
jgi:glycosyltransferase involved in cell wall biosynthesis